MERELRDEMKNEMELTFDAISSNEGLARVAVAAFVSRVNPTMEEISDVKTAVSEAVTNAIIHGYGNLEGYERRGRGVSAAGGVQAMELGRGLPPAGEIRATETGRRGKVRMQCRLEHGVLNVLIEDRGKGMEDVGKAMEPLYTTRPDLERSGMGFSFMEAFMDDLQVESAPGVGTIVRMQKKMTSGPWIPREE